MSHLLAPSWAKPIRLSQWLAGDVNDESLPTTSDSFGGETIRTYVSRDVLPKSELYPLLIRPVYKKIELKPLGNIEEKTSDSMARASGLCVVGHPGTGKTTCLWYLLIVMLRRGYHVLWVGEFRPDRMLLFSPRVQGKGLMQWDKVGMEFITVECFSREEVAWLERSGESKWLKARGCYSVLQTYDYLGPSLHALLHDQIPVKDDVTPQEKVADNLRAAILEMKQDAVFFWLTLCTRHPGGVSLERRASCGNVGLFYRIFKTVSKEGLLSKCRYCHHHRYDISFASPFVASIFYKSIALETWQEELEFVNIPQITPPMRAAYFQASRVRCLSWFGRLATITMAQGSPLEVPEVVSTAANMFDFSTVVWPVPGTFYVVRNCLTVDGLYEAMSGTIVLFQMAVAATQGLIVKEMKLVLKCYSSGGNRVALCDFVLVFVVSDKETRDTCLATHVNGIVVEMGEKKQNMRVGAVVVDHEN